jgi:tetratricopeptide (TPR) repeat protein
MIGGSILVLLILCVGVRAEEAAPATALREGLALEAEYRYDAARELYEGALARLENNTEVQFRLGHLYLRRLRDPERALPQLERACAAAPQNCECHLLLSEALAGLFMRSGVMDKVALTLKAKKALDDAVACDPRSVDYRKARIQYYLAVPGGGGYQRAHQEADELAELDPYAGQLVHASLFSYQGDKAGAAENYQAAIELKPDDPMGVTWYGNHFLRNKDYQKAVGQFERAVALDPDSADAHHDLGRAYWKNGRLEDAADALRHALGAAPGSTEIAFDLGRVQQLLGRTSVALELYRRCLVLDDPHGVAAGGARRALAELDAEGAGEPETAEKVQEASLRFFAPVTLAYLVACAGWMGLGRWRLVSWPRDPFPSCRRPWVELGFAGVAAVGLFLLGLAYRLDYLVPGGEGALWHLSWALNNLIIYSPVFIVVAIRRQGLESIFLSTRELGRKILAGAILAVVSTTVFLVLRGELGTFRAVVGGIVDPDNATNFLPVFLEGVALAFLFVRVRWAMGLWPAVLIPAVLFAAAHIPRQLAGDSSGGTIAAFFVLNTLLPAAILYTVFVSRDIIWMGLVHYVMDIAIDAFG